MAHSNTVRYAGRLAPKHWAPKLTLRLALSEIATCSTLSITRAQRRHVLVQLEGLSLRVGLLVLPARLRPVFFSFLFNMLRIPPSFPQGEPDLWSASSGLMSPRIRMNPMMRSGGQTSNWTVTAVTVLPISTTVISYRVVVPALTSEDR